jgi:hypothetical protein
MYSGETFSAAQITSTSSIEILRARVPPPSIFARVARPIE